MLLGRVAWETADILQHHHCDIWGMTTEIPYWWCSTTTAVANMRRTEILSIFIFFIRLIILEDFIRLISYNGPCVRLGCSFFLATALTTQIWVGMRHLYETSAVQCSSSNVSGIAIGQHCFLRAREIWFISRRVRKWCGFKSNNYSSRLLWVNSPWGRRPIQLLTLRPWRQEE